VIPPPRIEVPAGQVAVAEATVPCGALMGVVADTGAVTCESLGPGGPWRPCGPSGPAGPSAPAGPRVPCSPRGPRGPRWFQLSARVPGMQREPRRILMSPLVAGTPLVSMQAWIVRCDACCASATAPPTESTSAANTATTNKRSVSAPSSRRSVRPKATCRSVIPPRFSCQRRARGVGRTARAGHVRQRDDARSSGVGCRLPRVSFAPFACQPPGRGC
jgi:hypothetical protein